MKTLRTAFTASLFAAFFALSGCSAGALTGPDQSARQKADSPVQVQAPAENPEAYNVHADTEPEPTNGDGSTDSPDGYNLSPEDD